ncbi:hypothetical protein MRX96_039465 [Rhipicephalus microplus]
MRAPVCELVLVRVAALGKRKPQGLTDVYLAGGGRSVGSRALPSSPPENRSRLSWLLLMRPVQSRPGVLFSRESGNQSGRWTAPDVAKMHLRFFKPDSHTLVHFSVLRRYTRSAGLKGFAITLV